MTRSLGDSAMKEFVVGSPYTTETVLGDEDDILIIACDGVRPLPPSYAPVRARPNTASFFRFIQLWDVIDDQAAIDLVRPLVLESSSSATSSGSGAGSGAQEAAERLVKYALDHFSSDNISVLVVRLEGGWKGATGSGSK